MGKNIVIFDTEYTSWEGCLKNGWHLPQRQEIVQIGALKIDLETLEVVEEFCRFVIPTFNPLLSDYFINLTGITNEKLQQDGASFAEVYRDFEKFCSGSTCYSYAYPPHKSKEADGEVLRLNLEWNELPPPLLTFKNIGEYFAVKFVEHKIDAGNPSSGQLATVLGRKENLERLGLGVHNALYDVYSILEGLRYFGVKENEL